MQLQLKFSCIWPALWCRGSALCLQPRGLGFVSCCNLGNTVSYFLIFISFFFISFIFWRFLLIYISKLATHKTFRLWWKSKQLGPMMFIGVALASDHYHFHCCTIRRSIVQPYSHSSVYLCEANNFFFKFSILIQLI